MKQKKVVKAFLLGCLCTLLAVGLLYIVHIIREDNRMWAEMYADRVEYPLQGIAPDGGSYLLVRTEYNGPGGEQNWIIADSHVLLQNRDAVFFSNSGKLYGSTPGGVTGLYKNGVLIHSAVYDETFTYELSWGELEPYFMEVDGAWVSSYLSGFSALWAPVPERAVSQPARIIPRMDYDASLVSGIHADPMPILGTKAFPDGFGTVEYYVDVAQGKNGEFMWDDSQLISLLVQTGDGCYPIFQRERTNSGDSFYAWRDEAGGYRILLIRSYSFGVSVYEYHYDEGLDAFLEYPVFNVVSDV